MDKHLAELIESRPDLQINIRGPIEPGLSGATVWFADYMEGGKRRQGVLKLTDADKAQREKNADHAAKSSWLAEYLPTSLLHIRATSSSGRDGLLISLAGDRVENCQKLRTALIASFPYGCNQVLRCVGELYGNKAAPLWANAKYVAAQQLYCAPLRECKESHVEEVWLKNDLPPSNSRWLVFENGERWPNPLAFVMQDAVWSQHSQAGATIPLIASHGDLNDGNLLCPTLERWNAIQSQGNGGSIRLVDQISMIDLPYFRDLPFVYDVAFLVTWLKFLLPAFESRADRDAAIKGYNKAIEAVYTGVMPEDVPEKSMKFVECVSAVFESLCSSSLLMVEDVRSAFLASVAAAATWQAIRIGKSELSTEKRDEVVGLLCLAAVALNKWLDKSLNRDITENEFRLKTSLTSGSSVDWGEAASRLGQLLADQCDHRSVVLVLGDKWGELLGLASDNELIEKLNSNASLPGGKLSSTPRLEAVGHLPLAAVADWSLFDDLLQGVSPGVAAPWFIAPVIPGSSNSGWDNLHAVPWFCLRGHVSVRDSIALTERQRSRLREKLRELLKSFRGRKSSNLVVIYSGFTRPPLEETHKIFDELWVKDVQFFHICESTIFRELGAYHKEWSIVPIMGGVEQLLMAATDYATSTDDGRLVQSSRTLRLGGMAIGEDGMLVEEAGATTSVEIAEDDYAAIGRAGRLLDESERLKMMQARRSPREFFIGHHIEFSEWQAGVAIERQPIFNKYLDGILQELEGRHLSTVTVRSRPGAGASTLLRWLAWKLSFKLNVPTLILHCGGNVAFEAIERIQRICSRPFVVIADPQLVSSDEFSGLRSRCAPSRIPVVFLTSRRVWQTPVSSPDAAVMGTQAGPVLEIELGDDEREAFLKKLTKSCPDVPLLRLANSQTRSLFFMTLEAFGGEKVKVDIFVEGILKKASDSQKRLLTIIAIFSRYAHRPCDIEFLEIATSRHWRRIESDLEQFDQILILQENGEWLCRHDQVSKAIIQWCYTHGFHDQNYRHELARSTCSLIESIANADSGHEVASEYIWSLLNPQVEAQFNFDGARQSRLVGGEDGIPSSAGRESVFLAASEAFPEHINIRAHTGKFFSEELQRWGEAEVHLAAAIQIDSKNEAATHMMGKRFLDELRSLIDSHPARTRPDEIDLRIVELAQSAHHWFGRARALNLSSEFGYTTALQVNRLRISDEFRRHGVRYIYERPELMGADRIQELLEHSASLVAEGQRYIEPRDESRRVFNSERDKLHELRGDLNAAIKCFTKHVQGNSGYSRALAKVHLGRLYLESGEAELRMGNSSRASKAFEKGAQELHEVLQDPAMKYKNIKLWFDCARQVSHFRRNDFIQRIEQLADHDESDLDSVFLLMCLHFCDAVETGSQESWRLHTEYRLKSDVRSANLAIRRYIREFLTAMEFPHAAVKKEFRILPFHLFEGIGPKKIGVDSRVRLRGYIQKVASSTQGYIAIRGLGREIFFRPRAGETHFYKSDADKRRAVTFKVAFTYEKPEAIDVVPET